MLTLLSQQTRERETTYWILTHNIQASLREGHQQHIYFIKH